jgi:phage shock protein A
MVDTLENLQKLCDDLKRQRDELQVKLHTAKAEARDEWARLEARWEEAKTKMNIVRQETGKTTETVSLGLSLVLNELKNVYDRIRKSL